MSVRTKNIVEHILADKISHITRNRTANANNKSVYFTPGSRRQSLHQTLQNENDLFDSEKIFRFETLLELGQIMRELGVRAFEMGKGDFDRMNRSDGVHQIVCLVDYDYLGRGEGDLGRHAGARGIRKERRSEEGIRVSLFTCKL